jgi:hypothetical protein
MRLGGGTRARYDRPVTVRTREADMVAGDEHALVQRFQLTVISGPDRLAWKYGLR